MFAVDLGTTAAMKRVFLAIGSTFILLIIILHDSEEQQACEKKT